MNKNVLAEYFLTPWAMVPAAFEALVERFSPASGWAHGAELRADGTRGADYQKVERLAIIPIQGPIFPKDTWFTQEYGLTTNEGLQRAIGQATEDPAVDRLVLNVDSPGGSVLGTQETADLIYQARQKKPVTAVVGGMAGSAAYHMVAQASDIVVAPSSMGVGSIGIWMAHLDVSKAMEQAGRKVTLISAGKYKVDGNPYEPLSDTARADMQAEADARYEGFLAAVARGRGVTADHVRAHYGEGRMVAPSAAVAAGMADRVGTMRSTLVHLLRGGSGGSGRAFGTLREFEAFLRDAGGCSRAEAAALAASGYQTAPSAARTAEPADALDEETRTALLAFAAAMKITEAQ